MAIDLKEEMRRLLERADAEEKPKKPGVEPCLVCGAELCVTLDGDCWCRDKYCPCASGLRPVSYHNALARLVKTMGVWRGRSPYTLTQERAHECNKAYDEFQAECDKVKL